MKVKELLSKELDKIKPSGDKVKELIEKANEFRSKLKKKLRENKIRPEVFLGGSLAKGTTLEKDKQDIDIFVRFGKKYGDEEISELLKKALKVWEGVKEIHGSRDYFQLDKDNVIFEIVPVTKINRPEEARNVTDLSYFHVDYVKNKIENKPDLADQIRLAKHLSYSQDCYGAESYIQGFSGYGLELLIIYYGSFLDFVKAIAKSEDGKVILDPANHYKNEKEIMTNLNEAKLQSPVIFIDPTYKKRNALAALSKETFNKFKQACKEFLKNPNKKFFERKEINSEDYDLVLKVRTDKQPGDIAGSKLKKFFRVLNAETEKYFNIEDREFEYEGGKEAKFYFNLKSKERIIKGPPAENKKNVKKFKKEHKDTYEKKGHLYAKEEAINPKKFINLFKEKFEEKMKSMDITKLGVES